MSWHATPFEERLEKALSEKHILSQRYSIFIFCLRPFLGPGMNIMLIHAKQIMLILSQNKQIKLYLDKDGIHHNCIYNSLWQSLLTYLWEMCTFIYFPSGTQSCV